MSDDDECQFVEDNINYKSITCERIPDLFLDKLIAKKHFGKFGKISRFILRPNRFCCTVDYDREEDAANALENGGVFNGQEFIIRYSPREVGHVQNTEEWVDPDVQAELDAMGNQSRRLPVSPAPKLTPSTVRAAKQKVPRPAPDPTPSQTSKVPAAMRSELEAILRKPAYTDEDKYRILDARDKLVRLTTVRTTDINKVVSIKGTCPDMCPEKERYMREFQHQVSTFEMEFGGSRNEMDHSIAVKEYSRSSADQEVPLSHELRPEPVLKMTMLYLMDRIMGLCDVDDVNIGDWFHFVWDRTRSIRKDITQQELCSLTSVELVEQCARFHIHCAARLVAEDPSVFDQKINTENLTKCLQTLKYMYNDLRIKGIRCPREAEFRGYIVLLNLNDANFLWELQQLPEEIQNSKEVRSAIGFYKCMESNNYVKFFNLLRETSYMNACILLRYFTQVRLKALRMIIKAYNWPRHLVSLPLTYMTKILGFESEEAAVDFFSYYGLECDTDNVILDKNAFEEPDVPVLLERAFELVESKRQVGVGEAVCGRPLDPADVYENHPLQNSFDSNGYLCYNPFTSEERQKSEVKTTAPDNIFKVPVVTPPSKQQVKSSSKMEPGIKPLPAFGAVPQAVESIFSQKPTAPAKSSSIFKSHAPAPVAQPPQPTSSIFGSSVFKATPKNGGSIFSQPAKSTEAQSKSGASIFGIKTQSFAKDSVFQHFDAQPFELNVIPPDPRQNERVEQQKREEEAKRQKAVEEREREERRKREELEKQQRLAEERRRQEQLEMKRKQETIERVSKNSKDILGDLIEEVQTDLVKFIATKELQRHEHLEEITEVMIYEYISDYIKEVHTEQLVIMQRDQSLLLRCFHAWQELTYKKKNQRKLIQALPEWMSAETLGAQANKLAHPQQAENLRMIKRYRQGIPCDFKALLNSDPRSKPIDLFANVQRLLSENVNQMPTGFLKRRKYFKMVISVPGEHDELPGFNSYFSKWLQSNVQRRCVESSSAFVCHCDDSLALCVRKLSGIIPKTENGKKVNNECDHADALLFIMSLKNLPNSRKRLHHFLKLSAIYRPIPVAIVVYSSRVCDSAADSLDMNGFVKDGKISSFEVFQSGNYNLKPDFFGALRYLSMNQNYDYSLEAQSVVQFLNSCLGEDLWQRLNKSWLINPSFRKICSIPRYLIAIYNEAVDHLIDLINEDVQDYPEFPQELKQFVHPPTLDIPVDLCQFPEDWKNPSRVVKLTTFVKKLYLPPVTGEVPQEIEDLELWILNYTSACIPNDDELATKTGYHAIKALIDYVNTEGLQDYPSEIRRKLISWLPVIRQAALAVLNHQWMNWMVGSNDVPPEVVYNRNKFSEFMTTPWWLSSRAVQSVKMVTTEDGSLVAEKDDDETEYIASVITKGERACELAAAKLKALKEEACATTVDPELTRQLDETLYLFEVSEKCKSFETVGDSADTLEDEDSLGLPPVAKKLKTTDDEMQRIIDRAFAVLKKSENYLDHYQTARQEVQPLGNN